MPYSALDVASVYIGLFAARSDVYSRWVADIDPETQKPIGWRPVRSPLTPKIVLAGLQGQGPSISGYTVAPGSRGHVAALDFDTENGRTQADRLAATMWTAGLPAYVEPSRRGAHLWCILDGQLPAVAIRAALRALLAEAELPTNDPKIELRPGSDTISDDGLGHALRLPTMPHPKTGKRGQMLDHSGKPLGKTLAETLLAIDLAPCAVMHPSWSERWRPPVTRIPRDFQPPHSYPEETSTASEILRDLWGVPNAAPGRSVKCPAHADDMPSLSILRDDLRAICKSPSCELHNDGHGRGTYELRTMAPHVA